MARKSIGEALEAVLAGARPEAPETVGVKDALGRVLAEPVRADRDQPPFDRATMDGFAVRSADAGAGPAVLRIAGEVAAGQVPFCSVGPGEAIRIMTGAVVPEGADAIQMVEKTRTAGGEVVILEPVQPGLNVARRGEDICAGAVAVVPGTRLTPARLLLCCALGATQVRVHARPRVAVLATGDELVEVAEVPGPTQIRDSSRWAVAALVERAGARVTGGGIVRDDLDATRAAVVRALDEADVVLVCGGVSAGEYDYVARALELEGVEKRFHKVHMRPGKPLWFGTRGNKAVFGLPGNPVSSFVTTTLFVLPHLRARLGHARVHAPILTLPLLENARGTDERPTLQPAVVEWDPPGGSTGPGVRLVQTHGSGDVRHFAEGTALAFLPPNLPILRAGTMLRVSIDEETLLG